MLIHKVEIKHQSYHIVSKKCNVSDLELSKIKSHFINFLKSLDLVSKDISNWDIIYSELSSNALKNKSDKDAKMNILWWQESNNIFLKFVEFGSKSANIDVSKISLPKCELAENGRGLFLIKSLSDDYKILNFNNATEQIVVKSHDKILIKNHDDAVEDKLLHELECAYESLTAFRSVGDALIKYTKSTDFFNATLDDINYMFLCKPDLFHIFLSKRNEKVVQEELSFINNIYGSNSEFSKVVFDLIEGDTPFFWDNFSEKFVGTFLESYNNGCCFPLTALDSAYGSLILANKTSCKRFYETDENSIKTISDLFGMALAHFNSNSKEATEQRARHELKIASRIQKSLIPLSEPPISKQWNIILKYQSAYKVGGDYINALINSKGDLIMTLADVMGKGVSAAMVAAIYSAAFSQNVDKHDNLLDFAYDLNNNLCKQLDKLTIFITCAFIKVDRDLKNIHYINAGHPPILRYKNNKKQIPVEPSGPPIGIFKNSDQYKMESFPLDKGDSFLSITDGLYEWNDGGNWWGWSKFEEFADKNICKDPNKFWDDLVDKINENSVGDTENKDCDDRAMLYWEKT